MDVISMARELGKAMQQDPRYLAYQTANEIAEGDEELQDLIGKFNLKKIDLQNEIQNPDKTQESLHAIDEELKDLYSKIMENANMIGYNLAKREMDSMLSFIQNIITSSANGEDPDTVEEEPECTGSCSTCGGCH